MRHAKIRKRDSSTRSRSSRHAASPGNLLEARLAHLSGERLLDARDLRLLVTLRRGADGLEEPSQVRLAGLIEAAQLVNATAQRPCQRLLFLGEV